MGLRVGSIIQKIHVSKSQDNEGPNRVDPNSGITTANNRPTSNLGRSEGQSKNARQPFATDQPFATAQPKAMGQPIARDQIFEKDQPFAMAQPIAMGKHIEAC